MDGGTFGCMTRVLLTERAGVDEIGLEEQLRRAGFEIAEPTTERPDVVIAADRAGVVERWREEAPVIVLGTEDAPPDERVRAFQRGCDDYVLEPFDPEELVERVRAIVRRTGGGRSGRVVVRSLELDPRCMSVLVSGTPVRVSQKEFDFLRALAADPERVFTRKELLRDVWGYSAGARTRTIDSHASRLRRKLRELDPLTPFIDNVWGVGYRLVSPFPEPAGPTIA